MPCAVRAIASAGFDAERSKGDTGQGDAGDGVKTKSNQVVDGSKLPSIGEQAWAAGIL